MMAAIIVKKAHARRGQRRSRAISMPRHPMRRVYAAVLLAALAFLAPPIFAQAAAPAGQPLPIGFRGITLGMGLDQVKQMLKTEPLVRYRGDPDVSFLPQTSQFLIECEGNSYLRRAYFQFADSRLFIMILVLDTRTLDHFSLYSALFSKYGQPASLSPQEVVWQSGPVRFSLERPLTVKYIDTTTFSALLSKGGAQRDLDQLSREKFIEQF